MKGVSHGLVGLFSVVAFHLVVAPLAPSLTGLVPVAGVALVAALLPDVDSDESTIRQVTGTARHQGCIGQIASWVMRLAGGHRGAFTHSLLAWAILSFAAGIYSHGSMLMVAFAIGYLSHLLADALTVDGVPLFWPLVKRRIVLLPSAIAIHTGGVAEQLVIIALGVIVGLLWLYPGQF